MNYKNLAIEIEEPLVTITLNRPEKLNALSIDLLIELREYLGSLEGTRKSIRGIILTGAGTKAFSAGGDIKEMSAMNQKEGGALSKFAHEVTMLIERLEIPVIACVDGFALGGGCELAMACDFIYATKRSSFGQPEVKIGMIPGFGGCVRLMRLLGPAKTKELIFTGRPISASHAQQIGLVNEIYDSRDDLLCAARKILYEIAHCSPNGVFLAKKVISSIQGVATAEALQIEEEAYATVFEHSEKQEGINAFLEKRVADF